MRNAIAVLLVIVVLFLSGCTTIETAPTSEAEQPTAPVEEVADEAEEVIEEVEEAEEAIEEVEEAAESEEAEEALEEEPEEVEEEGIYNVKKGDIVEFDGKTIEFTAASRSNGLYFNVDGYRSNVQETSKHEIVQGIKVTYVSATDFMKDQTLKVKIEKLKLAENEYLVEQNSNKNIEGVIFLLDQINLDSNSKKERAYISFPLSKGVKEITMRTGETVERANLSITMEAGYYKAGNLYGIFKVVPA
ncbi:MAG: hypothetical protein ABIB71_03115 [Candidatus Woesearchaeota archaeon]